MAVQLEWDDANTKTIIRQNFIDKWTWDNFYISNSEKIPEMMNSVDHTVHVLSDFRESGGLPVGGAISHARNVMNAYPENWGILVVISDSSFINNLVRAFSRIFAFSLGKKTYSATTLEEAYQLVEQHEANSH